MGAVWLFELSHVINVAIFSMSDPLKRVIKVIKKLTSEFTQEAWCSTFVPVAVVIRLTWSDRVGQKGKKKYKKVPFVSSFDLLIPPSGLS